MANDSIIKLAQKKDAIKKTDENKISQQHKKGKLTARERRKVCSISLLPDPVVPATRPWGP